MAQVPYSEGVPQVGAETRTGDDYQHIQPNPAAFGGEIAQGLQQAGTGATKTANFFGQVAGDNAANDYQDQVNKILHGDPNKTVVGPDGKPAPDLGYLGLRGRAALDARPDVEKSLDATLKNVRAGLSTPDEQLRFDDFSRRYRSYAIGQVGTHADTQANTWYQSVNTSSAKLGLDHISNNADNPQEVAHGASDVINAYTKNAELHGAMPGDDVWNDAMRRGRQDAFKAQLEAISVHDPSRALRMVEKNKGLIGQDYEPLSRQFRERADQQDGITAGTAAIKNTYQTIPPAASIVPVLDNIGRPYGISGSYLLRTHELEGNGVSSTGAQGPFQFVKKTATEYGVTDPYNFGQAADGAARLAANNKVSLTRSFGRAPTDAELYLAHQQGAGGAAALLQNPTLPAADALALAYHGDRVEAAKHIADNGGDPNAPAAQFTSLWTARFNGAAGAINHARKASAYDAIMSDPNMSEGARNHALRFVNQTLAAQQVAEESDLKAKQLANDNAANGYVTQMLNGQPVDLHGIANDNNLDWKTKEALTAAIEAHGGSDVDKAARQYGPGFWDAYKKVLAAPDDAGRINDQTEILRRAGPGGDLTLSGAEALTKVMVQSQKSVNDQAVNRTKLGLLDYMKGKLSFEQDIGPLKIRDPKGEALFNSVAIPKFEAAYDAWTKAGKNPWEFLTRENIDKLMQGVRPSAQMAQDRMKAFGAATGEAPDTPLPPAPENVDPVQWIAVMKNVPLTQSGQPIAHAAWANMLNLLISKPTPETIENFNKSQFGKAGFDGAKLIAQLQGKQAQVNVPHSVDEKENNLTLQKPAQGPSPAIAAKASDMAAIANLHRAVPAQTLQDFTSKTTQ